MVLNVFSITTIFVGIISAVLIAWGGVHSFILFVRLGRPLTLEEKTKIENRSYLVLLIAVVTLAIRLFSWPLFYTTLWSFVPDIEGAMCIFGVTQVKPAFTKFIETVKPFVFWLIGAWLLLHVLDQATKTSPLMRRRLLLLSLVSIIVFIDSIGEAVLVTQIRPGSPVSCCTTVTDLLNRPTRTTPESLLGLQYAQHLGILYFVTNLTLIGLIALILWRKKLEVTSQRRRLWLGFIFLFSLCNAVVFLLSQIEVIAPKIMHLPYHHCLYCLWQYVPDSMLMFLLFVLGTFAVGWAFGLDIVGRVKETADILPRYLKGIYTFGLSCLSVSLIIVILHLVAG